MRNIFLAALLIGASTAARGDFIEINLPLPGLQATVSGTDGGTLAFSGSNCNAGSCTYNGTIVLNTGFPEFNVFWEIELPSGPLNFSGYVPARGGALGGVGSILFNDTPDGGDDEIVGKLGLGFLNATGSALIGGGLFISDSGLSLAGQDSAEFQSVLDLPPNVETFLPYMMGLSGCTNGQFASSCAPAGGDLDVTGTIESLSVPPYYLTPEPASFSLLGAGLAALALYGWRRSRSWRPVRSPSGLSEAED